MPALHTLYDTHILLIHDETKVTAYRTTGNDNQNRTLWSRSYEKPVRILSRDGNTSAPFNVVVLSVPESGVVEGLTPNGESLWEYTAYQCERGVASNATSFGEPAITAYY